MLTEFLVVGALMLMSSMFPGPDFALVSKNTVLHSRRAGIATSLGISCAILVHITYCVLGFAVVIAHSSALMHFIRYCGAAYLFYLGFSTFIEKNKFHYDAVTGKKHAKTAHSFFTAFRQGVLCNLLNPKATLFFLALFTMIVEPGTSLLVEALLALEMFLILFTWFCVVTIFLSHSRVMVALEKVGPWLTKLLGIFLMSFGVSLVVL